MRDRKQRHRAKPLLVPGLPDSGKGQFVTPTKMKIALATLRTDEAQKEQEQREKEERAVQKQYMAALKKEQLEERKEERAKKAVETAKNIAVD
jgi:hypothetical protein